MWEGFYALVPIGIIAVVWKIPQIIHNRRLNAEIEELKRYDFEWYRKKNPDCFVNNRVICVGCRSANIGVERARDQTYMRTHICRTCGGNLYFSSE